MADIADAMGRDRAATAEAITTIRGAVKRTRDLLDKINNRPPLVGPAS